MDGPRAELERALALENETERKLAVVAVIGEVVRALGWRPVVIGGLAVEYWTHGAYSTSDIDLYLPRSAAVDDAFFRLGFEKEGRSWVLPEQDVFVEAPATAPAATEAVVEAELAMGQRVSILSLEDVLIDRLHQFVSGGHADVAEQSVALLGHERLDTTRLDRRAREEGLERALAAVRELAERVAHEEKVQPYELHEIAKRLQTPP
jgi:hypothetical protein